MRAKAVLFDMDGVLVRSEEVWFRLVEEAGRRFRGRLVTREEFSPTFGQGTEADVASFALRCTPAELDRFYLEEFFHHADGLWVNPEAAPLLDALCARGLLLAVVTNTVSSLAERILQAAQLDTRVHQVSCADLVPNAKPAPDLVLHACAALKISPTDAWMVGDSRFDREAAQAAQVRFVGLGIEGDARIERLVELEALLLKLA
ncbi:MAG: HAD family hydrolase [Myxococcota bacterium]